MVRGRATLVLTGVVRFQHWRSGRWELSTGLIQSPLRCRLRRLTSWWTIGSLTVAILAQMLLEAYEPRFSRPRPPFEGRGLGGRWSMILHSASH